MNAKNEPMKRRNISWKRRIDIAAVRLAADEGGNVSELLERLVQAEAAKMLPQSSDNEVVASVRGEIARGLRETIRQLAERFERSGNEDLEKAAKAIKAEHGITGKTSREKR